MADRLGVSTAAVLIGALGVAAAAVAGWWALRTPPGPPVEEILPTVDSVSPLVTAPDAMPVDSIVVHVVGAVARPGVHEVSAGSRVVDAVQVAGGLTDDADPARLNLAEPLHDGARVWVPAVGEAQGAKRCRGHSFGVRFSRVRRCCSARRSNRHQRCRRLSIAATARHRASAVGCHRRVPRASRAFHLG